MLRVQVMSCCIKLSGTVVKFMFTWVFFQSGNDFGVYVYGPFLLCCII